MLWTDQSLIENKTCQLFFTTFTGADTYIRLRYSTELGTIVWGAACHSAARALQNSVLNGCWTYSTVLQRHKLGDNFTISHRPHDVLFLFLSRNMTVYSIYNPLRERPQHIK